MTSLASKLQTISAQVQSDLQQKTIDEHNRLLDAEITKCKPRLENEMIAAAQAGHMNITICVLPDTTRTTKRADIVYIVPTDNRVSVQALLLRLADKFRSEGELHVRVYENTCNICWAPDTRTLLHRTFDWIMGFPYMSEEHMP